MGNFGLGTPCKSTAATKVNKRLGALADVIFCTELSENFVSQHAFYQSACPTGLMESALATLI